ncbi:MAG: hypothetical protein QGG40_01885 [Myxococcota bacterium]|jgi:hypothetical protein|nr:hypothetical protein [Myxococcota bacterium]
MMWILFSSLTLAAPVVGVDWTPLGRSDLAWIEEGGLSGTGVAEGDGVLDPNLSAWGGVAGERDALLFGLGIARSTSTALSSDQFSSAHVGALRPAVDYRRYLQPRAAADAVPYLQLGTYGVVPSARYFSDAYTDEEQEAMDDAARQDRARIGAVGLRMGGGAEVAWPSGLMVGARYLLVAHRGADLSETAYTLSTVMYGEAALQLGFAL